MGLIDKRDVTIALKKIKKMDHTLILKIFLIIALSLTAVIQPLPTELFHFLKKR